MKSYNFLNNRLRKLKVVEMLPITFALQHEEMLRILNENLQVENTFISIRQNYLETEANKREEFKPLDLSKPKYYTAESLKNKWIKLCSKNEKKRKNRPDCAEEQTPNKRQRTAFSYNDDQIMDPFAETEPVLRE